MQPYQMFFVLMACLFVSACGPTTKITETWVDTSAATKIESVLVMAITKETTPRKLWENAFVDQFSARSITAVTGHSLSIEPVQPTEEAVVAVVEKSGAAMVLISHLVKSSTSVKWNPGTVRYVPSSHYYGMYGYYGHSFRSIYTPPTTTEKTVVQLESNLYDARTARLLWTARSATINPKLTKKDFESVVSSLMSDLARSKLL